jgi:hypothetical protein
MTLDERTTAQNYLVNKYSEYFPEGLPQVQNTNNDTQSMDTTQPLNSTASNLPNNITNPNNSTNGAGSSNNQSTGSNDNNNNTNNNQTQNKNSKKILAPKISNTAKFLQACQVDETDEVFVERVEPKKTKTLQDEIECYVKLVFASNKMILQLEIFFAIFLRINLINILNIYIIKINIDFRCFGHFSPKKCQC